MTQSIEAHTPNIEGQPLSDIEAGLTLLHDTFVPGFVPTLAKLDAAAAFVNTVPRDTDGNLLNEHGMPVDPDIAAEVQDSIDPRSWRLAAGERKTSRAVLRVKDETKLSGSAAEAYEAFQSMAVAHGLPGDFASFQQHEREWVALDDELIQRDETERAKGDPRKGGYSTVDEQERTFGYTGGQVNKDGLKAVDSKNQAEEAATDNSGSTPPPPDPGNGATTSGGRARAKRSTERDDIADLVKLDSQGRAHYESGVKIVGGVAVGKLAGKFMPKDELAVLQDKQVMIREALPNRNDPAPSPEAPPTETVSAPKTISELAQSGFRWKTTPEGYAADMRAWEGLRYKRVGDPGSGRLSDKQYHKRLQARIDAFRPNYGLSGPFVAPAEVQPKTRIGRIKKALGNAALDSAFGISKAGRYLTKGLPDSGRRTIKKYGSIAADNLDRLAEWLPGEGRRLFTLDGPAISERARSVIERLRPQKTDKGAAVRRYTGYLGHRAISTVLDLRPTSIVETVNLPEQVGAQNAATRAKVLKRARNRSKTAQL